MIEQAVDLASECEQLARDFGRLALADVSGAIVTERRLRWCRRPVPRIKDYERLRARISAKPRDGMQVDGADGCELADLAPQTADEMLSAPVWYGPIGSEPFVNIFGHSMVMESGWSTLHEWEIGGTNASHAASLLERAGEWTFNRWGWLSELLWPGRGSVAGSHGNCWLDVVNQASKLANNANLPRPNWSVIVGEYRSWWPVAMWKIRDEWQLGEPQYTPEDFERIGDDPEVVLASRKHWLKDSETALEWLANKLRNQEQTIAPVVVPADPVAEDGLCLSSRVLTWGGVRYSLTPNQMAAVKVLYDAYSKGKPDVGLAEVKNKCDSAALSDSFAKVFQIKRNGKKSYNPVLSIIESSSQGTYRLKDTKKV